MSWLKKTFHKVKKSVKRLSKGKIHLTHSLMSSTGNKKWLPARARHLASRLRFGYIKSHLHNRLVGNNSANSIYSVAPDSSGGYRYQGKTISELM